MRLEKNLTAPVFQVNDVFGRMVDLNQYQDKKILIAFFRHSGCPFCNIRVHTLSKMHEAMKNKGMEMIFFFESPQKVISMSTFHKELSPIPIISDPEKVWYQAYGLENSTYKFIVSHLTAFVQTSFKAYKNKLPAHMPSENESLTTMPAEFLIDKGLVVKKVHYSERLTDRMNVDVIKVFADGGEILG